LIKGTDPRNHRVPGAPAGWQLHLEPFDALEPSDHPEMVEANGRGER